MDLRTTVLDLVKELDTVREAGKHFDSQFARQALDQLIELVARAASKITEYYKRSKIGEFALAERYSED